jgi:hypothetical protein
MTRNKITSVLKRDINKLKREQYKEQKTIRASAGSKNKNGYLLAYLITRKNTLQEVLKMIES